MNNKSEVVPSLLNATSTYIGMVVRLMLLILPLLLVCILCNCLISRDTWQYQHLCNQIFAVFNLDHILLYKDHHSKFYIILLRTILVCRHRSPIIYVIVISRVGGMYWILLTSPSGATRPRAWSINPIHPSYPRYE